MGSNEPTPLSLIEAAEAGDDLGMALANRRIVAATIQGGCPARELASLTKRLHEINREIKELLAQKAEEDGDAAHTPPEPWDDSAI